MNVFYILVIHTDNTQVSFILIEVCQPGGIAMILSKSPPNQSKIFLWYWNYDFSTFKSGNDFHPHIVSNQGNFESKKIHSLRMACLWQISLAKVRGNERFSKSVVWFCFRGLLEKILAKPSGWQTSINIKLTWALSLCIICM